MPKGRAKPAATILSVSKDKELLFLRAEILKSAGYKVVNAMSVEECIGALSDSIDLLLVGHSLSPEEALMAAKSAKEFSNDRIGVIVIRKTLRFAAAEHNIDEFIDSMSKPEELLDCIKTVLRREAAR